MAALEASLSWVAMATEALQIGEEYCILLMNASWIPFFFLLVCYTNFYTFLMCNNCIEIKKNDYHIQSVMISSFVSADEMLFVFIENEDNGHKFLECNDSDKSKSSLLKPSNSVGYILFLSLFLTFFFTYQFPCFLYPFSFPLKHYRSYRWHNKQSTESCSDSARDSSYLL